MDRGAWWATSLWGRRGSDTTEWLNDSNSTRQDVEFGVCVSVRFYHVCRFVNVLARGHVAAPTPVGLQKPGRHGLAHGPPEAEDAGAESGGPLWVVALSLVNVLGWVWWWCGAWRKGWGCSWGPVAAQRGGETWREAGFAGEV